MKRKRRRRRREGGGGGRTNKINKKTNRVLLRSNGEKRMRKRINSGKEAKRELGEGRIFTQCF